MKSDLIYELPESPSGRIGWPWTGLSQKLPDRLPGGGSWPKISVITPSYNQEEYIEETIRSVLLQGYPNLEYVIIDGGSTDGSVDIIRKYERWLAYWISEPDRGQSHAINKGYEHVTGEILSWLNSDDAYLTGALFQVAQAYIHSPDRIIAGAVVNVRSEPNQDDVHQLVMQKNLLLEPLVKFWERKAIYQQPGLFFPRRIWEQARGLDTSLHFAMDYDLLCQMLQFCQATYVSEPVARFRIHPVSKTYSKGAEMFLEKVNVSKRYWALLPEIDRGAFVSYSVEDLVRWAGTHFMAGRFGVAISYLRVSLSIDPFKTFGTLLTQLFRGLKSNVRRLMGAAAEKAL